MEAAKKKLIPKGKENLETQRELKILPSRSCCFLRLEKTWCLMMVPCGVCVTWGLRVLETWRLNSGHWGPKSILLIVVFKTQLGSASSFVKCLSSSIMETITPYPVSVQA